MPSRRKPTEEKTMRIDGDQTARLLQSILDVTLSLQSAIEQLKGPATRSGPPDEAHEGAEHRPRATAGTVLTGEQRRICEQVINVYETGTIAGKYGAISIYRDGPGGTRQITYGRSQTTEYGNLRELVAMYANANGRYSDDLRPYVVKIGNVALVDNQAFKDLLKAAGNEDPVMRDTQDLFFDRRYLQPALRWAADNGFRRPLSLLGIYDSFIHSGSILGFLRERFPERTPASGGNEEIWIRQYVDVRHAWLSSHSNPAIRASNYRTRDLAREIAKANWDLAVLPFMANGTPVYGRESTRGTPLDVETGSVVAFPPDGGRADPDVSVA